MNEFAEYGIAVTALVSSVPLGVRVAYLIYPSTPWYARRPGFVLKPNSPAILNRKNFVTPQHPTTF